MFSGRDREFKYKYGDLITFEFGSSKILMEGEFIGAHLRKDTNQWFIALQVRDSVFFKAIDDPFKKPQRIAPLTGTGV